MDPFPRHFQTASDAKSQKTPMIVDWMEASLQDLAGLHAYWVASIKLQGIC